MSRQRRTSLGFSVAEEEAWRRWSGWGEGWCLPRQQNCSPVRCICDIRVMTIVSRGAPVVAAVACVLTLSGCAMGGSGAAEARSGADLSAYAHEVETNSAQSFGADTMDGLCDMGLSWPCRITDLRAVREGVIELETTLMHSDTVMAEKLAHGMYAGDGGDHDLGSITVYDSKGVVIDEWTAGDFPGML